MRRACGTNVWMYIGGEDYLHIVLRALGRIGTWGYLFGQPPLCPAICILQAGEGVIGASAAGEPSACQALRCGFPQSRSLSEALERETKIQGLRTFCNTASHVCFDFIEVPFNVGLVRDGTGVCLCATQPGNLKLSPPPVSLLQGYIGFWGFHRVQYGM